MKIFDLLAGRKSQSSEYDSPENRIQQYFETANRYGDILTQIENQKEISTELPIKLLKIDDTLTKKKLEKSFGKPLHRIHLQKPEGVEIYYYKRMFDGQRIKLEFHFYGNQLLFSFYIYSGVSEKYKKEIIYDLERKYALKANSLPNDFKLLDAFGNMLSVNCKHIYRLDDFSLNYIWNFNSDEAIRFRQIIKDKKM